MKGQVLLFLCDSFLVSPSLDPPGIFPSAMMTVALVLILSLLFLVGVFFHSLPVAYCVLLQVI